MVGTVHSFYQNVYMADAGKNEDHLNTIINEQKDKIYNAANEIKQLKMKNDKLTALLKTYRNLLIKEQPFSTPSNKRIINNRNLMGMTINSSKKCSNFPQIDAYEENKFEDNRNFMGISKLISKMSKVNGLRGLITLLYSQLETLLNISSIGIFIADPSLRKQFQNEHAKLTSISLGHDWVDYAFNENIHAAQNPNPIFNSIASISKGLKRNDVYVAPVFRSSIKSQVSLAIQVELKDNESQNEPKGNSNIRIELLLKIFCAVAGVIIDKFALLYETKQKSVYQNELISFCKSCDNYK